MDEAERMELAISQISGSLGVERVSDEPHVDFLERLAEKCRDDLENRIKPMVGYSEAR